MGKLLAIFIPKSRAAGVRHAPPVVTGRPTGSNTLNIKSVIAAGAVIDGDLDVKENIIINGTVRGNVRGKGCMVLIKGSGRVCGSVEADKVYLSGEVSGGVCAAFVRLFPSSRLVGRLAAKHLVVDMGASIGSTSVTTGGVTIEAAPAPVVDGAGTASAAGTDAGVATLAPMAVAVAAVPPAPQPVHEEAQAVRPPSLAAALRVVDG